MPIIVTKSQWRSRAQAELCKHHRVFAVDRPRSDSTAMASQQQPTRQSTTGGQGQEEGARHGARGQQGQEAMNLEEIGKYRAEAQQHSADVIRAAEERFNRANQRQNEGHGCGGGPEAAAQSYAGATAALRAKETKKASSTEAGQEGRGNVLTRQGEMGHGRQADKVSEAEAVRAAVEKRDKGKKAGGQQQSEKDTASRAVGDAEAKDAGARGAAEKSEQATHTQQVTHKAKEVTTGAAHRVAEEYSKEKAEKGKGELGSVKTTKHSAAGRSRDGVTGRRRHEHEEPRRAGSATASVAQKASDTAWRARDKAGEARHRASSETGSGGTARAKVRTRAWTA
jgi:hypothetical protein